MFRALVKNSIAKRDEEIAEGNGWAEAGIIDEETRLTLAAEAESTCRQAIEAGRGAHTTTSALSSDPIGQVQSAEEPPSSVSAPRACSSTTVSTCAPPMVGTSGNDAHSTTTPSAPVTLETPNNHTTASPPQYRESRAQPQELVGVGSSDDEDDDDVDGGDDSSDYYEEAPASSRRVRHRRQEGNTSGETSSNRAKRQRSLAEHRQLSAQQERENNACFHNLRIYFHPRWQRAQGLGPHIDNVVFLNPNREVEYRLRNNPLEGRDFFVTPQAAWEYCLQNCTPRIPLPDATHEHGGDTSVGNVGGTTGSAGVGGVSSSSNSSAATSSATSSADGATSSSLNDTAHNVSVGNNGNSSNVADGEASPASSASASPHTATEPSQSLH